MSGGSVLQGVNSSALGNDTLDVNLERRHESEELSDELDLLSEVLEPLHSGLFHFAILLNLRCGQLLLQSCAGLFHAGLFHELARTVVET